MTIYTARGHKCPSRQQDRRENNDSQTRGSPDSARQEGPVEGADAGGRHSERGGGAAKALVADGGVAVAEDITLDDYRDLGAHVNEHHDRPGDCRCWGYDDIEALSPPHRPCGPCRRLGFTEPAPDPDDADTETVAPEDVGPGEQVTLVYDSARTDGYVERDVVRERITGHGAEFQPVDAEWPASHRITVSNGVVRSHTSQRTILGEIVEVRR